MEKIVKVFITAISQAPWRPCFWRIKFLLAIFVAGHLVTISAKLFSSLTTGFRRRFFIFFSHRFIRKTGHAPWWPCFLTDHIRFCYFCRCHPVTISTKLFWIRTTGFRGEDLLSFCYHNKPPPPPPPPPLAAMFLTDQLSLAIFVDVHLRNIPMKFDLNWPGGKGRVVIES